MRSRIVSFAAVALFAACSASPAPSPASPGGGATATPSPGEGEVVLRTLNAGDPGGRIELKPALVPGRLNVVDFYSRYCGPCVELKPRLEALAKKRPDAIAVLQVDVNRPGVEGIDWESPVADQFALTSLPYLVVIDRQGEVAAVGEEASLMVKGMLLVEGIE